MITSEAIDLGTTVSSTGTARATSRLIQFIKNYKASDFRKVRLFGTGNVSRTADPLSRADSLFRIEKK